MCPSRRGCPASLRCVALIASWEPIATHDLGPTDDGKRLVKVQAVAVLDGGELRWAEAKVPMTAEELALWVEACQPG